MKQHIQGRMARRGEGGFTLIELLVVIAILGILSAVVVFAVGNTTDRAQEKACAIEKRTIRTAIAAFDGDTGANPTGANSEAVITTLATGGYLDADTDAADVASRWALGNGDGSLAPTAGGKCAP